MGKFDGFLICTDLDGTLLKNDKTISEKNLEAIEYFKKEGGYFTFVTGRMPFFVSYPLEKIKPNAPVGCVNGAGLYSFHENRYIWTADMPLEVLDLVERIDNEFPDVGIQVNTYQRTYFCKENQTMENFRKLTGLENLVCHYRRVQEPIAKILFGSESDETIRQMERVLKAHPSADKFSFVRSEKTLYEILPKDVNKGTSISKLCEFLNVKEENSVAIGDYNNDIPMFYAAGVGVAVSNACKEALEAADFITVSNEENAIAKVIGDLEAGKYGKR